MTELLSAYGGVALSRIGLQIVTSGLERKKTIKPVPYPTATLIVPTYNEPIDIFIKALAGFKRLDYDDLQVIIVDDGSPNASAIRRATQLAGFDYIYQENAGKRDAIYTGIKHAKPESKIIFLSDSDTVWQKDAAKRLADTLYADKQTGAVTGEVSVLNYNDNLMTRIINMRYHMAFAYERASQSYFKTVTCISGPLGAYRREIIESIKDDLVTQTFLGKKCNYGDDRHLTNLVLIAGYKVRYAAKAKCYTQAPVHLLGLLRQQSRWGKSYWREIFWQVRALRKHGLYLTYDFLVTSMLPFLLIGSTIYHIFLAFTGQPHQLIALFAMITFMSTVRIIDPMLRQRDPWYLAFLLYALLYFLVLLPVKLVALFTLTSGQWGTRNKLASAELA